MLLLLLLHRAEIACRRIGEPRLLAYSLLQRANRTHRRRQARVQVRRAHIVQVGCALAAGRRNQSAYRRLLRQSRVDGVEH